MKIKYSYKILIFLIAFIFLFSCKKTKNPDPELTVSALTITFAGDGGTQDITITSNADRSLSNPAFSWLKLSAASGNSGSNVGGPVG